MRIRATGPSSCLLRALVSSPWATYRDPSNTDFPFRRLILQEDQTQTARRGRDRELYGFTEAVRKALHGPSFADLERAAKALELVVCCSVLFLDTPECEELLWHLAVKLEPLCCRNFLEISLKPTEAERTHSHLCFLLSPDSPPYGKLRLSLLHFKEKFGYFFSAFKGPHGGLTLS